MLKRAPLIAARTSAFVYWSIICANKNILYFSYIYLPTYLKSCFLYCTMFPEDYTLRRKVLIRLWIAEVFIENRDESTLEEVTEGYLVELVHRNML